MRKKKYDLREPLVHIDSVPDHMIANNLWGFAPTHPGEMLSDDLGELDMTPEDFAKKIDFDLGELLGVLQCKRPMTTTLAEKIEQTIGTPVHFYTNVQKHYDDWTEHRREHSLRGRLKKVAGTLRKVAAL